MLLLKCHLVLGGLPWVNDLDPSICKSVSEPTKPVSSFQKRFLKSSSPEISRLAVLLDTECSASFRDRSIINSIFGLIIFIFFMININNNDCCKYTEGIF